MSKQPTLRFALDQLQVREPCHESWDAMHLEDGGQRRHCDSCAKSVHDFSTMTRAEVDALLSGPAVPCVRFARGADGRVLTREDFEAAVATQRSLSRRGWLRRVAAIAATLGIGSLFNIGCDSRRPVTGSPVAQTAGTSEDLGSVRGRAEQTDPQPMGKLAPIPNAEQPKLSEAVMGDIALATKPTTKPTMKPATRPTDPYPVSGRTMGIIAR